MFVQALSGAISPNFRMVAIAFTEPSWQLIFVLENDDAQDREEIEDVLGEFDALTWGVVASPISYQTSVVVDTSALGVLDPAVWRVVFRRRES